MDETHAKISVPLKKRKLSDGNNCFLCNEPLSNTYVVNPTDGAYKKLVTSLNSRVSWGDANCKETLKRFQEDGFNENTLRSKKVKWHRSCYNDITNKTKLERLKIKFNQKPWQNEEIAAASEAQPASRVVTRTQVPAYDKTKCFFCDRSGNAEENLRKVATDKAGKNLYEAVKLSRDEHLRVRLAASHDPEDAHAIDVMYHVKCWADNVTNVLRKAREATNRVGTQLEMAHNISKLEFITVLREALRSGKIFSMDTIEGKYISICRSYKVDEHEIMYRKALKKFISMEMSDEAIEFSRPKKLNEPERLSMKISRDVLLQMAEDEGVNLDKETKILYQAANILRRKVNKQKSWRFQGDYPEKVDEIVPNEVRAFFKWCVRGESNIFTDTNKTKNEDVEKRSEVLSQIFVTSCLTERQAKNRDSSCFHSSRETPLNVGLGLLIHKYSRDKKLIELLHRLGLTVDYDRILRIETQIATSVIKNMHDNRGVFIPADVIQGKFIHCAFDNIDFLEDTPDGKRTLHGTVMTIYQVKDETTSTGTPVLTLKSSKERSLEQFSEIFPDITPFRKPITWTTCSPVPKNFANKPSTNTAVDDTRLCNLSWIFHRKSCLKKLEEAEAESAVDCGPRIDERTNEVQQLPSLTWAGFMSSLTKSRPTVTVATLPVISLSPTDHGVQIAVMKRFEEINAHVLGADQKVVVTVDMALYKPIKQIEMADQNYQQKWILKPGELHIIIAMQRTIGAFIQNSGIPELWSDSELYGTATTRQILDGKHVRRGLEAHCATFSALSMLLLDEFMSECNDVAEMIEPHILNFNNALKSNDSKKVQECNATLLKTINSSQILGKLTKFCNEREINEPVFKFSRTYMEMVEIMLSFLKAVRSSDWLLSLESLRCFTKYFFALDRQNYARMIPLYLSEMDGLEKSEPTIWKEFLEGNWVVNKNKIPFSALGDDEALEHENRRLKVQGGLTGMTLNESARTRFFLTDVELTNIALKLEKFAQKKIYQESQHHSMSTKTRNRQDKNVLLLKESFERTTNPFSCRNANLIHFVSQQIFTSDIEKDVGRIKTVGEKMFLAFNQERIETCSVPFWSPMQKVKLNTCKSANKKIKIDVKGKITEIKADTALLTRLIVASRSRNDVDMKTCISKYELSAVPRSLFASNGSMHHCLAKYKLAEQLESLPAPSTDPDGDLLDINPGDSTSMKVAIVDGMALLHTISKPGFIKTCHELGVYFCKIVSEKYETYDEIHMVFDSYKEGSLKTAIRNLRQSSAGRSQYQILPTTNIRNTTMKKLLSHEKTKDELTDFFAKYLLNYGSENKKNYVVSWRGEAQATNKNVSDLASNQEEADTKIILHGLHVATEGRATTLHIFSPDTDVLILALRRYPALPPDSGIFLGVGMKRFVSLKPIFDEMGPLKAAALPALHALSGCDTTGYFANKGKVSWWRAFQQADNDILEALAGMGSSQHLSDETISLLEKFICHVYVPKTGINGIGEARWWLFTKKHKFDDHLPPTKDALLPALSRANFQAIIWRQDINAQQNLPSPDDHGWRKTDTGFEPIPCRSASAPSFLLDMIKCNCKQSKCAKNCSCRTHGLECTEMCQCNADQATCQNLKDEESEDEFVDPSSDEED